MLGASLRGRPRRTFGGIISSGFSMARTAFTHETARVFVLETDVLKREGPLNMSAAFPEHEQDAEIC